MSKPFAVPSELNAFMQEEVPEATAKLHLATASGAVRGYCHWAVAAEEVEGLEVRLTSPRSRKLFLPTLHIRSLNALSADNVLLAETLNYEWDSHGAVCLGGWWPYRTKFVVDYSHGYLDDHPAVQTCKGIVLAAASRLAGNPSGNKSETTGGETIVAGSSAADSSTLTKAEKSDLDPWVLET